jgi:hypothetical protein
MTVARHQEETGQPLDRILGEESDGEGMGDDFRAGRLVSFRSQFHSVTVDRFPLQILTEERIATRSAEVPIEQCRFPSQIAGPGNALLSRQLFTPFLLALKIRAFATFVDGPMCHTTVSASNAPRLSRGCAISIRFHLVPSPRAPAGPLQRPCAVHPVSDGLIDLRKPKKMVRN